MRRFVAAASMALLVWIAVDLCGAAARAAGKDRRFSSGKYGVTVDAPAGWDLSVHTGYPDILAVLVHPNGSRLSVAATDTQLPDAREAAEQNRTGLQAQGLTILGVSAGPRNGATVDAQSKTGKERVRQIYLVRTAEDSTRQLVVLTLTAPRDLLAAMAPTLDTIAARIAAESPPSSAAPAPPSPGGPRAEKIPAAPAPH